MFHQTVWGEKYKLMAKSRIRDGTESALYVPEIAKQYDVFNLLGQLPSEYLFTTSEA